VALERASLARIRLREGKSALGEGGDQGTIVIRGPSHALVASKTTKRVAEIARLSRQRMSGGSHI